MSKFKKTTLATALLLVTAQSSAAGFQVSEHSASGLGRAFAGEAAVADNASVIARNPAAMSLFDKAEISVVGSYIVPNADITGTNDPVASNPSRLDSNDIINDAFVPAMYYVQPINDTVAVGLAMFSGYGMVSEHEDDYAVGAGAGTTDLLTFSINPNVSFKATDELSLGLGVSAVYAKATLERNYGDLQYNPRYGSDTSANSQLFLLEGDAWGYGWNAGALYELNENNRIGLAYRSQVDIEFEGDFTGATSGGKKIQTTLEIPLPATAEISGYHKLTPKIAVTYSALWTQWSKFTELEALSNQCVAGECFKKEEHYDDNMRYAVGTEYYVGNTTLRAGFAFDEQAGETTLSIPDTDRYWYTIGATYELEQDLSFDFALAYIYTKEIEFSEYGYTFEGQGDAIIASAQANYRF
ncbi:outer membrane protein transport protein [Moritella sp. 36]|uniref:outer membrane protein transport protein n=1 Tax=Moritella sp. 36 TaxID=2746233 RepID=UPI001BA6E8C7|nr:outer membrane protein transport protein [Moritella sp. 36]QUM90108.1 outer membrane protein transport protein [Moritella sp. 36]